jgi:hypothetical protein
VVAQSKDEEAIEMKKKTYYVTVDLGTHAGEIRETFDGNDAVYDYEIQATEEELAELEHLYEQMETIDDKTFLIAHIPFLDNEQEENEVEDELLNKIYRKIYELGTEQTKRKMEEAGLVL